MTIYSLDTLLFLFGTSLLFHVQLYLLLPDLHTSFSRGRQFLRTSLIKYHKMGDYWMECKTKKQTKKKKQWAFVLTQFWSTEIWNQAVSRTIFSLQALRKKTSLPFYCFWSCWHFWHFLASYSITPLCVSVLIWLSSLYWCICVETSLIV